MIAQAEELLAELHFSAASEPETWIESPDAPDVFGAWRSVHLRNWVIELRTAQAIGRHAVHLERLLLDGSAFDDDALDALLAIPEDLPLRALALHRCDLEARQWALLAGSALCARLRSIALSEVDDRALACMLGGDRHALRTLSIDGELGPLTAAALASGSTLGELRALALGASSIDPLARSALVRWQLPHLELLELDHLPLAGRMFVELAGAPMMQEVRCLLLGRAKIGTEGVEALSARPLPRLRILKLWGVTDRGAEAIAAAPWIAQIESLTLIQCRAGERGLSALRAALPAGHTLEAFPR
jgi:hypothetical protein